MYEAASDGGFYWSVCVLLQHSFWDRFNLKTERQSETGEGMLIDHRYNASENKNLSCGHSTTLNLNINGIKHMLLC